MTDQIAPSLATELEQMAKRYHTRLEIVALLTRAAALARAAEKVLAIQSLPLDMNGDCYFCDLDPHKPDCEWAELRALVSSEGGK